MATEQDHIWAMLDDMLMFLAKRHVPTPERTYKLDGGWTLAMDDLRRFVDRLIAERDQLRAQLETATGLRRALEAGKADRWAATVGNTETNAFAPSPWVLMAETALAASPDEHERRIKAEALRATAKEMENLRDHIQEYIAPQPRPAKPPSPRRRR